jgi:hypothetical protein
MGFPNFLDVFPPFIFPLFSETLRSVRGRRFFVGANMEIYGDLGKNIE